MSITKLSLGGNYDVIYKLFPPRESLVSDIPAENGNIEKLFFRCMCASGYWTLKVDIAGGWIALPHPQGTSDHSFYY
jgi:hypothetical protein